MCYVLGVIDIIIGSIEREGNDPWVTNPGSLSCGLEVPPAPALPVLPPWVLRAAYLICSLGNNLGGRHGCYIYPLH